MRKFNCFLLACIILLSSAFVCSAENGGYEADIDISEFLDDFGEEDISLKTPESSEMITVAENSNLKLCFDEKGMDLFVFARDGRVWSNVITDEFLYQESPSFNISSALLSVMAADESEAVSEYTLYDGSNRDIRASASVENERLILEVSIKKAGISFSVEFGIRENGFYYTIPDKSIKEENGGKIISISMLQNFGAVIRGENGYMFYPDGCGAIMRFDEKNGADDTLQQISVYGSSDLSFVQLERNWEDNIYGALLPVWGISTQNGGLLAIIESGEADAKINISMPGYQIKNLYRVYASFHYRTHSDMLMNDTNFSALTDKRSRSDHGCYFELLSGDENNYGGMARAYRKYLTDKKILYKHESVENTSVSLNILCGVQKNGIFGKSYCKMTTYAQARKISDYFAKSGIKGQDTVLSGWSSGGWDRIPTEIKAERKLGGKSGLEKLNAQLKKSGGRLSLDVETVIADKDTGKFNMRKDAARNYFGKFYCDKTETRYVLNAKNVISSAADKFASSFDDIGINFLTVGKLVYPNYSKGNFVSRQGIVDSYLKAMKKIGKNGGQVGVTTGNAYALSAADMIYSLPSDDSGYTFTSEKVPFYQMVVHGYIPYTGTAGNTHYDYERCVLEWVENGCVPSYILNWESTARLLKSNYNSLFSSEFSVWREKIKTTVLRLEKDFADLKAETMERHTILADGVIEVVYSDGTQVFINYNETDFELDGKNVGGKNYLIAGE